MRVRFPPPILGGLRFMFNPFIKKYYKFFLKPRRYGKYFDPYIYCQVLPGQTYSYDKAYVTDSKKKCRRAMEAYFSIHTSLPRIYEARIGLCRVDKDDIIEKNSDKIFVKSYTIVDIENKDYTGIRILS